MSLRIRQIVLAAHDLAGAVARVEDKLGLQVAYRDPGVAKFGLDNALLPIGEQFLEIVSPTRPDTAAGRHLDRHGDSAYMLILQTDDLGRDRGRLADLGVRIVWESSFPDMRAAHLHPKDIGAAIVSLDEATPPDSWRWAGPSWRNYVSNNGPQRIVSATIGAREPMTMARRWSQVLGLDAPIESAEGPRLILNEGCLNFVSAREAAERIVEFGLQGTLESEAITLCGTTFRIES